MPEGISIGLMRVPALIKQFLASTTAAIARAVLGASPLPQAAAGVGEWKLIEGTDASNLSLPAGGTWAYFVFRKVSATGACFTGSSDISVAAGGTVIIAGAATFTPQALAWRIA